MHSGRASSVAKLREPNQFLLAGHQEGLTLPHRTQRIAQRMQRTFVNQHIIRNFDAFLLSPAILPSLIGLDHGEKRLVRFIVLPLTLQRNAFQSADDGRVRLFGIPLLVLFDFGEGSLRTTPFELV